MMKKKCMLIAVLCVSLLAGCENNDEKTTEVVVNIENKESVDAEKNTVVTNNENDELEDVELEEKEEMITSEPGEDAQADLEESTPETREETNESGLEESVAEDTNNQTSSDFYMVATSKSAEEVEAFAANIRNLIVKKDWSAFAEQMNYPFVMDGNTVENSSDFLALDLDGRLNQAFVDAIEAESCKEMFCNYQGIMMGNGEVWIADVQNSDGDFELKVFAINGMLQ